MMGEFFIWEISLGMGVALSPKIINIPGARLCFPVKENHIGLEVVEILCYTETVTRTLEVKGVVKSTPP